MLASPPNRRVAAKSAPFVAHTSGRPPNKLSWVLLTYIFCVVIPFGFNLGPLLMTGLRGLLILITLPLIFGIFTNRYGRILVSDVFFLLHLIWMTIALAVNNPDQVVQQIGSLGIEFIGGYAVGRAYIRSAEDYLSLCHVLVLAACVLMPFAVVEALTGTPIIIKVLKLVPGMVTVPINDYDKRLGLSRVQVSFAHPIHFGLFYSIIFSQIFVALRGQVSDLSRYLLGAIIAATGFLALSSGALLSMFLQMGLIFWGFALRAIRYRWWILVICFFLAYVTIDVISNRSAIQVFMSYATFSAYTAYYRAIIFEWGVQNILASPFVGIGMKDWFRPPYMHNASVDNFWLLIAMRYGIPGFLLLAFGFLFSLIKVIFKNLEYGMVLNQIRRAWVFTFLGLAFTLSTVHIWTNIYSFVFFIFGAGMWMISSPKTTALKANADAEGVGFQGADQMPVRDSAQPLVKPTRYSRYTHKPRLPNTTTDVSD